MDQKQLILETAKKGSVTYTPIQMQYLKQFSDIDCGTGNEEGNKKVISIVVSILKEMNAEIEYIYEKELGTHLIARIKPENPTGKIILNAHLDTVFEKGMTKQFPFHIKGDYAYGLGIADCKSGILICLYSVKIMQEAGLLPKKEITFLFNCDEETGSQSGRKIYEKESRDAEFAFVFEGGRQNNQIPGFVTARRGVILGSLDIEGKEAHAGAHYLEGRSAVKELAHQILRLYSFNDMEKKIYYNVSPISGGRPNGIVAGNAHAEFCVAGIPTKEDMKQAEKNILSLEHHITVKGCKVKTTYRTLFPPMEKSSQNQHAFAQLAKAAKIMGIQIEELEDPSATDACYFSAYEVPTVDALSALSKGIHTTQECVYIPSIQEKTEFFAVVLGCLD